MRLCRRVGRLVDGFIDASMTPAGQDEPLTHEDLPDPRALHEEALRLIEALPSEGLEPERERWLRAQLRAVETVLERLGGGELAWADEVERCLGVRPTRADEDGFRDVHRRLEAALGGSGTLRHRYLEWEERTAVPTELIVPALERMTDVLRPRARALATMPEEETVTYQTVSGVPWIAYNRYEGRSHSRVEVNADFPVPIPLLVDLAAHESYPGHHTERAAKEAGLLRALGRVETSVVISPGPESLVSEGIGMIALEHALGPEPFDVVADALRPLGVAFDPAETHEVHRARDAFYDVGVNAAFLLHEDGATAQEAEEYLRAWGLESDARAARTVAFLTDPASRAYVSAYPDGGRLCRAFARRASNGFTRLLTQQLTPADLGAPPDGERSGGA